ncbi:isochorismatase family protein [Pararhodobacter oceanensis]|uniref:N-carbamoylsarcosine amidohydrolase n=1 Tax=Pararhodobacter oceanensis TaxID=2172121 RepID=A0A2T8HXT8_9RHOB|nr:isochorismatase family protein [Pararhodobacter oceanensis]PVH30233.1 N-carbamoylsarcosine amidohydrolase [Pararhodobacter oceanensis]
MIPTDKTAKQIYHEWQAAPRVPPRGMGQRVALLNVDVQRRYTDTEAFASAYTGHPRQFEAINTLAETVRALNMPVIWTYVAYLPSGVDAGWWSKLSDNEMSIHKVGHDSPQAEIDPRVTVDDSDLKLHKRMASAFFETHLLSYLNWHHIDTVIVTGGATSGCVRGTIVDAMSYGYRVIVPEECVTDREESAHYASLYDIAFKYGDVKPVDEVLADLSERKPA